MYRRPGNLHLSRAAPLEEYAFTMAMITTEATGESAPSKAPDKPVAMSSL